MVHETRLDRSAMPRAIRHVSAHVTLPKLKPTIKGIHFVQCSRLQCSVALYVLVTFDSQNRSVLCYKDVVTKVMLIAVKNAPIMLELCFIIPALCFMLSFPYYARNYAGIIDASLVSFLQRIGSCCYC